MDPTRRNSPGPLGLAVYAFLEEGRVALRTLLVAPSGQKEIRSSRRFDFLSEELLEALIFQSVEENPEVAAIFLGLPGVEYGELILSSGFARFGKGFLKRIAARHGLPVYFLNDVDAMIYGEFRNRALPSDSAVLGISLPEESPGGGILVKQSLRRSLWEPPQSSGGALPYTLWVDFSAPEGMAAAIAELLTAALRTAPPCRIVIFSRFLCEGALEEIKERMAAAWGGAFPPEILLKASIERSLEGGMAHFTREKIFNRLPVGSV